MSKADDIRKYLEEHKDDPKVKDLFEKVKHMSNDEINKKLNSKQASDLLKQIQGFSKQVQNADEAKKKELMDLAQKYLKNMPADKKKQLNQLLKSLKK